MRGLARCDEASQANLGCTLPTGTEAAARRGRDADEDGLNLNACAPRFTLPSPSKSTSKSTTRTTQQRPTSAKHSESLNNFRPMVRRDRWRGPGVVGDGSVADNAAPPNARFATQKTFRNSTRSAF